MIIVVLMKMAPRVVEELAVASIAQSLDMNDGSNLFDQEVWRA